MTDECDHYSVNWEFDSYKSTGNAYTEYNEYTGKCDDCGKDLRKCVTTTHEEEIFEE